MIPANFTVSHFTKRINTKSVNDIKVVTAVNLILFLQDISNLSTIIPPKNWPIIHPESNIIPEKRKKNSVQKENDENTEKIHIGENPFNQIQILKSKQNIKPRRCGI